MKEADTNQYRVRATHKRQHVKFTVTVSSGKKATAEARRLAKGQGMNYIMVNYVMKLDKVLIGYAPFYEVPLNAMGGTYSGIDWRTVFAGKAQPAGVPILSVNETNARIEKVWGRVVSFVPRPDRAPLKAYEADGRVFWTTASAVGRNSMNGHQVN